MADTDEAEAQRINQIKSRIAAAEQNIIDQLLLVDQLRTQGKDSREAEYILETMQIVLSAYRTHHHIT